ncbi:MAG: DNA-binding protein [Mesorhizobium sp.]|uniref:helix-turn-helix domain-containing protein n=1 Tax=Mesorhizobium sp. TaxID=1871066 RepID=UPI000FE469FC|nr:helix-turn-helix domain-containing protein [Mesorhizobium sp.]RWB91143.1 MAG: DNA-binding protein [Mesorhizobium sp.]
MRKRSTEQTFVKLYLWFAKRGHFPLPPRLSVRKNRKKNANEGDLRTPSQAARFLKVGDKTLANWRVKGTGPAFLKIGSRVVYDFAELKAFAASRSRSSTSDKGDAK